MEREIFDIVHEEITRRYPHLSEAEPSVSKQGDNYLIIYRSAGKTPDGQEVVQLVRVVASGSGKILKISMSR